MNGIIVIDKPKNWTSMDVCAKLRGVFHEKRIGHSGTLDPMATGVLPVFVGRATRAIQYVVEGEKEYQAVLRLGQITDTQDVSGIILEKHEVNVSYDQLEEALKQFRGEIIQIPPMYSAVKINGKRLYELAQKGKEIERKPRSVFIQKLDVTEQLSQTDYMIHVVCSKGTYIRTLCHDIGTLLGCGGTMASLRRLRVAEFSLDQAVTLQEVLESPDPSKLLSPIDLCFTDLQALKVDSVQTKQIKNGMLISIIVPDGYYRVYGEQGEFLALGQVNNGRMSKIKGFFEV